MSDDNAPIYIGDGVYVRFTPGYSATLMANDAKNPTDVIVLEDYVLAALVRMARQYGVLAPLPTEDA